MLSRQILIDTDFHRYADDYEAVAMVAALVRRHEAKIAGITTVTGNAWASNCAKHARDALVELGLDQVPVHQGAEQPLIHRQSDFAHRSRLYGAAFGGAWGNAALLESSPLIQPKPTNGAEAHAVEFLVTQLRNASEPVTILSIGPFTNIALAVRIAPDIVPKIGALFVMGGAFYVQGNVTPSAEFNWWFDAESAAIVLEQNIEITVVPLDATDSIVIDCDRYRRWEKEFGAHWFFTEFHQPKFGRLFDDDPSFELPVWDALAAACLIDSSLVTRSEQLWLSVDCSIGPSYGRAISYSDAKSFNLEEPSRPRATVVLEADQDRFWSLYESLIFSETQEV